ncbi:hypothetical protein OHB26_15530 [Nocardia sp. NBC_01503]|uniref:hypothetical protein n=1 Tax=Nocardia sp. NBC_01503 TaxID=2975997 RepID=UPI002E7B925C|nr:hypothetical protein [Nocardia sp. NBC_01503]WTL35479.1 hypothetical protein OHB26_15530 [Nocardia sp. NBC_01503]
MAVNVVLDKVLDKAYEDKSVKEILSAPPSALAGLTEKHDTQLLEALGVKTIADLGNNKFFRLAATLVELAAKEG